MSTCRAAPGPDPSMEHRLDLVRCQTGSWISTGISALKEVMQTVEEWRIEYNTERPHRALGQQTPAAAWMTARECLLGSSG
jgi:hypothetical protein